MPVLWRRVLVFGCSLIPLLFIGYKTYTNQLGADPAKTIVKDDCAVYRGMGNLFFIPYPRRDAFAAIN
jgi:hypothetical protein